MTRTLTCSYDMRPYLENLEHEESMTQGITPELSDVEFAELEGLLAEILDISSRFRWFKAERLDRLVALNPSLATWRESLRGQDIDQGGVGSLSNIRGAVMESFERERARRGEPHRGSRS